MVNLLTILSDDYSVQATRIQLTKTWIRRYIMHSLCGCIWIPVLSRREEISCDTCCDISSVVLMQRTRHLQDHWGDFLFRHIDNLMWCHVISGY